MDMRKRWSDRNRGLGIARLNFLASWPFSDAFSMEILEIGGDFLFRLRNWGLNRLRISKRRFLRLHLLLYEIGIAALTTGK